MVIMAVHPLPLTPGLKQGSRYTFHLDLTKVSAIFHRNFGQLFEKMSSTKLDARFDTFLAPLGATKLGATKLVGITGKPNVPVT